MNEDRDRPPTLNYRRGGPVGRPDPAARLSVLVGAAALTLAIVCWGWAILTLTPLRGLNPIRIGTSNGWFLLLPGVLIVVWLGGWAASGDEPLPGSRLGTWSLVLVALLWLSGLILLGAPRGWGIDR